MEGMKSHIANILTFGYDPDTKTEYRDSKPSDWKSTISKSNVKKMDELVWKSLDALERYNTIGIALSSGIDSVLLLQMIRLKYPEKKLVAIHYDGINPEIDSARKYAERLADDFVTIQNYTIFDDIQWMVSMAREPFWDCYNYTVFDSAKNTNCDCLVTGDGADELFGGYTFRYQKLNGANTPRERVQQYLKGHARNWVPDQTEMFGPEIDFSWEDAEQKLITNFANDISFMNQVFMTDFNGKLLRNFVKKAHSFSDVYRIDLITPYTNPDVMRYGLDLAPEAKYNGNIGKLPLRELASLYKLKVTRKKYGFSHDIVSDWNGKHWQEAHDDLTNPKNEYFTRGLISWDWVKYHSNSVKSKFDPAYVYKFMQLLALEEYLRRYG